MGKDECQEYLKEGHLNEAGISLYVDKMLLGETDFITSALLEHVENCQKCKSEIIELYETCKNYPDYKSILDQFSPKKGKVTFKVNFSALFKIAAIIIIIISLTFLFKIILIKNRTKSDTIVKKELKDTSIFLEKKILKPLLENTSVLRKIGNNSENKKQIHSSVKQNSKYNTNFYAANYKIFPDFESFIEESYRSEFSLKITEPKTGQELSVNKPIFFKWKSELDEKIKIVILNNKAEIVYEIKNITDNKAILYKKLQPGLYYWKIEAENDLLFLGKFIIR